MMCLFNNSEYKIPTNNQNKYNRSTYIKERELPAFYVTSTSNKVIGPCHGEYKYYNGVYGYN